MSTLTKCAGLLAGVSAVAVIGLAVAQSEPPNPLIGNHAIGAGQQSTHYTPMGETGVLVPLPEVRTATVITPAPVAVVTPPPAPVAEPAAPAPAPVAAAPAPEPPTTVALGAAPEPAPMPVRADRN
ncbi:MAG TPA: hypothetical protein VNN06_02970 [Ramlibacter sp.]|nr:hypothetical protein [Ramlibacter sp.]